MEERPKRHSFGKGLLCGILLCVVAMGVGGCAAPYFYKMFTHTSLNKVWKMKQRSQRRWRN